MADKRMFSKKITRNDMFLNMPISSRLLYYELNMDADDEGFVNNPFSIMKMIGCSQDDMNMLLSKQFVLAFENGVVVIKDWQIHNTLRADRIKETNYTEERSLLSVKTNKSYDFKEEMSNVSQMTDKCPLSVVEISVDKCSVDNTLSSNKSTIVNDIIDHLNLITGKSYKSTTNKTKSLINARLKDGFTLDDFKSVIELKHTEWNKTDMQKYLRPETLFGTKFESYLNQKPNALSKNRTLTKPDWYDEYIKERSDKDKAIAKQDDAKEIDVKKVFDTLNKL